MIYLTLALLATTVGSLAGIGGGVILKPFLDLIGAFDVKTVSALSSITVLSMAIVSSMKYRNSKTPIKFKQTIPLGIGSILGGVFGEKILSAMLTFINETRLIVMQNLILIFLMVLVYIYMNNKNHMPKFKVTNIFICILAGFTLGSISSMLSIGGGPINVCIFAILFSMDTKEASVNSIIVILLSQLSKLTFIILKGALPALDLGILLPMIMGGILGGIFGSTLNNKLDNKNISLIFNTCLIFLIFLNGFNIYKIQF